MEIIQKCFFLSRERKSDDEDDVFELDLQMIKQSKPLFMQP